MVITTGVKKRDEISAGMKKKENKFDLLGIKYGLAPDPKNPEQCIYKLLTQQNKSLKVKKRISKPK